MNLGQLRKCIYGIFEKASLPPVTALPLMADRSLFRIRRVIERSASQPSAKNLILTQSQQRELRSEGYCRIDSFVSAEICAEWVAKIDQIMTNHPDWIRDAPGSDRRIFGVDRVSLGLGEFGANPQLLDLAAWYLGGLAINLATLAARLDPSTDGLGSGGSWHRDANTPQFKCMVYLTDVNDIEDGAFQIVPCSHRLMRVLRANAGRPQGSLSTRWENEEILAKGMVRETLTGAAGTLLIFDSSALHRGAPLLRGRRYALTNYYYPASVDRAVLEEHFGVLPSGAR